MASFTSIWLLFVFILISFHGSFGQTQQVWMAMEPLSDKPMLSMFTGIYRNRLYLVGGHENVVTTLNLENIVMDTYGGVLIQPDLNVDADWETELYWYTLPWGIFCTQMCSTQIENNLYIVSPYRNISGKISNSQTLFIYDMTEYEFPSLQTYHSQLPQKLEGSCILNNNSHIFVIGGGYDNYYSNSIILVKNISIYILRFTAHVLI